MKFVVKVPSEKNKHLSLLKLFEFQTAKKKFRASIRVFLDKILASKIGGAS